MIQFILMLLGLAFPNNNANTSTTSDNNPVTVSAQSSAADPSGSTEDTSGETEQTPPPRK